MQRIASTETHRFRPKHGTPPVEHTTRANKTANVYLFYKNYARAFPNPADALVVQWKPEKLEMNRWQLTKSLRMIIQKPNVWRAPQSATFRQVCDV